MSSFNVTFKIAWPSSFASLMDGMYAPFNLDIMQYFGPIGCAVQTNYLNSFVLMMGLFALLIMLLLLAALAAWAMKQFCPPNIFKPKYDMKTVRANVMRLINSIVFMMYPGLSLRIFRVFAIRTYGGVQYLEADMSIRTNSKEYAELRGYAIFFAFLYTFCIPCVIMTILYLHRKTISKDPDNEDVKIDPDYHSEVLQVRTEFGSIYGDYRRKYFYWEIVEMIRKVILIGALVLVPIASLQIFLGVLICFVYSFMAALMEPFNDSADQTLQFITALQLFLTLATGFYINYRGFEIAAFGMDIDEQRANDKFIEPLLLVLGYAVFACIFAVIYIIFREVVIHSVYNNCKALLEKRKVKLEKQKTERALLTLAERGNNTKLDGKSKYVVVPTQKEN
jgi:hypothetical protein